MQSNEWNPGKQEPTPEDSPIYPAIAAYFQRTFQRPIPPGVTEVAVDRQWWFAINNTDEERLCSGGVTVKPYHAYVTFRGWPAGMISPFGGFFVAHEYANDQRFVDALGKAK